MRPATFWMSSRIKSLICGRSFKVTTTIDEALPPRISVSIKNERDES